MTIIQDMNAAQIAQIAEGIEALKAEHRAAVEARINKEALAKLGGEEKAQTALDAAWAAVEAELGENTINGCADWFRNPSVAIRRLMTTAANAAKAAVQ